MPVIFLANRAGHLVERMDDPGCDPRKLSRTYAQFRYINRYISGWGRLYKRYIRPTLSTGSISVLDIGCGGGDIARMLCNRATRDGLRIHITATDTDERAIRYMKSKPLPDGIDVRCTSVDVLMEAGEQFDIVLSNNVLHHISETDLVEFMEASRSLARRLCIHSDIRRDDLGFVAFLPSRLLFPGSFITVDGLTSIRKSYRPEELRTLLPVSWEIKSMAPFRNVCIWQQ